MKKTVLFEPKLLAEVKRKSPAVYEFYRNSPPMRFEFVDYGTPDNHMFIQKEILEGLNSLLRENNQPADLTIETFQIGYLLGRLDLRKKFPGYDTDSLQAANLLGAALNLTLNYPYYTFNSLMDADNFDCRDDYTHHISYSSLTYQEGQYFEAWDIIFSCHEDFNGIFKDMNIKRKRENLDNIGILKFTSVYE